MTCTQRPLLTNTVQPSQISYGFPLSWHFPWVYHSFLSWAISPQVFYSFSQTLWYCTASALPCVWSFTQDFYHFPLGCNILWLKFYSGWPGDIFKYLHLLALLTCDQVTPGVSLSFPVALIFLFFNLDQRDILRQFPMVFL
jgi:hypothetical protein